MPPPSNQGTNLKPQSTMTPAPPPPGCQEIPGIILTLPDGRWLTQDGQATATWSERGVWADEIAANEFLNLIFPEDP